MNQEKYGLMVLIMMVMGRLMRRMRQALFGLKGLVHIMEIGASIKEVSANINLMMKAI